MTLLCGPEDSATEGPGSAADSDTNDLERFHALGTFTITSSDTETKTTENKTRKTTIITEPKKHTTTTEVTETQTKTIKTKRARKPKRPKRPKRTKPVAKQAPVLPKQAATKQTLGTKLLEMIQAHNKLAENTDSTFSEFQKHQEMVWRHQKEAERIKELYTEMARRENELHKTILETYPGFAHLLNPSTVRQGIRSMHEKCNKLNKNKPKPFRNEYRPKRKRTAPAPNKPLNKTKSKKTKHM